MASLDFSEYKKIKTMDFYPLWLYAIFLLVIKKLFNYDDEKFEKLGSLGAKFSLIIRIAMKYFVSLDRIFKGALTLWKMYYTVGDLKIIEYDKEKKYAIGRLENFRFTPLHCPILKGYLSGMIGMVIKSPVSCEETKCLFQGDEYDEFLFKW